MPDRIVHLQWEGPFHLPEIKKFSDKNVDYGIYQVYGRHPVYGGNTLLYIGIARDQTFAKRIGQEDWKDLELDRGKYQIYVGRLAGTFTPSESEWKRQIKLAEALLITDHSPALNKVNVSYLSEETDKTVKDLHILNWGDYGTLLPEISGLRWSSKFDSPPDYAYYGNHKRSKFILSI